MIKALLITVIIVSIVSSVLMMTCLCKISSICTREEEKTKELQNYKKDI